ncbi:hypothetical protein SELMODRAFT_427395 [Selaginella moellendorffii]|uniref:HAT C-terminal dimerisation domain-containing protein n=1 Tax=Selaginella moellendorffii TaxID=88036 RepID=D8SZG3_SELML|nr:hypothetical protein SELMODRAFT_427395 [Selaginella moellendorffii]
MGSLQCVTKSEAPLYPAGTISELPVQNKVTRIYDRCKKSRIRLDPVRIFFHNVHVGVGVGVNIDFGGEIIWEMGRVPADEDNLEGTEPEEGCEVGEGDATSVEEKEKKIRRGKWQPAWVIKWRIDLLLNMPCQQELQESIWYISSTNMKTSSFHAHGQTKDHKHSIYIAEVKAGGQSSIATANDRQREAAEKGVICLFRTAYAIAQGFVPLRKYPLLLELQQLNGVYVPSMYKNVMACSRFITFINKVLLDQILEKVKASPFFGIMLDESTDISTSKHLIFYVTYIHDARVLTSYLGLSMVNNSSAEDWGLDMSRFVGFGSDSCNVMTGNRTGVAARLKEVNPFMTSTHCLSHRANLCVEDVYKNPAVHNLCDEVDQVVNKVAAATGTIGRARLQGAEGVADPADMLVEQGWSHYQDVSFKFLYALHFLGDILAVVNQLNLEFQAQTMDVTSVAPLCKATMAKIQLDSRGYPIIPDGGRRNGPLDELRSSVKGNEYRDMEMIRSIHGEDLEEVLEFQKNFGTSLLEGIRTRLQDSEATGILSKFHFLAPINLPSSVRELKAFGMINEAELAEEYSLWKIIASEEWKGKTFVDVWGMIYAHSIWTKKYPNLLKLAMVGMVQCCNIASCERGFSRINLVKNKFRNQMGTEMVDELVRISIEGPPIAEFDFETVEFIRMRFPLLRIMPYTKNTLLHTGSLRSLTPQMKLLVFSACILVLFSCHGHAVISVQQGDLSEVDSSMAILRMSGDSLHKQVWWQFLPLQDRRPEAFLRYMVGAVHNQSRCDFGHEDQNLTDRAKSEIRQKKGLLGTRGAAIAEYQSVDHIKSLGTMRVTVWILAYLCVGDNTKDDSKACDSVAPVILTTIGEKPAFRTVWEVSESIRTSKENGEDKFSQTVSNSLTARILELSSNSRQVKLLNSSDVKIKSFQDGTLISCSNKTRTDSKTSARRNLMYGDEDEDATGSSGVKSVIDETGSSRNKTLVGSSGTKQMIDATGSVGDKQMASRDFSTAGQAWRVQAQRVQAETILGIKAVVKKASDAGYYAVERCYQMDDKFNSTSSKQYCRVLGMEQPLNFLGEEDNISKCEQQVHTPVLASGSTGNFVACSNSSADGEGYLCVQGNGNRTDVLSLFHRLYPPPASWRNDTNFSEINNVQGLTDCVVPAARDMCLAGTDFIPSFNDTIDSEVGILEAYLFQLKNLYIQAHSSALNLEQGAATDFWVAAIALPSTFIAVVATTEPLTNSQLSRLRSKNLRRKTRYLKTALLLIANLLLAIVSYSAVIAMMGTEMQRQAKFVTWGLHADQVQITQRGLQVLAVIQGESTYKSKSLLLAWISIAALLPIVALITVRRCMQVFEIQELLQKGRAHKLELPGDEAGDDLRAIEMTRAQHEDLKKAMERAQHEDPKTAIESGSKCSSDEIEMTKAQHDLSGSKCSGSPKREKNTSLSLEHSIFRSTFSKIKSSCHNSWAATFPVDNVAPLKRAWFAGGNQHVARGETATAGPACSSSGDFKIVRYSMNLGHQSSDYLRYGHMVSAMQQQNLLQSIVQVQAFDSRS